MAVESGRRFWMIVAVRPGHELKKPLLMVLIQVDLGGLNAHWWRNWMSFSCEGWLYAELAESGGIV